MNARTTEGPARSAIAAAVRTNRPAPMIAPMPSATSAPGPRVRLRVPSPVERDSARSVSMDLVRNTEPATLYPRVLSAVSPAPACRHRTGKESDRFATELWSVRSLWMWKDRTNYMHSAKPGQGSPACSPGSGQSHWRARMYSRTRDSGSPPCNRSVMTATDPAPAPITSGARSRVIPPMATTGFPRPAARRTRSRPRAV